MAITTSLTWTADNLTRETTDDFIIKSYWYLTGRTFNGTVGIATFRIDGPCKFNTSRTGSEIAYESVTQENVVGWVKNTLGAEQVAEYERLMHENLILIHKNVAGITTDGVPSGWSEPEEYISSANYYPPNPSE
tara:strand:+ start:1196 stop:1597 length:402 start_codon:yes stop_codon:yes gene_type:complete